MSHQQGVSLLADGWVSVGRGGRPQTILSTGASGGGLSQAGAPIQRLSHSEKGGEPNEEHLTRLKAQIGHIKAQVLGESLSKVRQSLSAAVHALQQQQEQEGTAVQGRLTSFFWKALAGR
ncbi:hypothetical protein WJX73_010250 [Symbiochloris irregularis]|uniref:Uncharacterized protein n=1 Tax=Symbiochloris irregularis TaxID=706552 RepID=A0AAW1NUM9_9CHLO